MKGFIAILIWLASIAIAVLCSTFLPDTVLGVIIAFVQGCGWGWIGSKLALHLLFEDYR